jgi:hypothetical protein
MATVSLGAGSWRRSGQVPSGRSIGDRAAKVEAHLRRPSWERNSQQVSETAEAVLDLLAREREQPTRDGPRLPIQSESNIHSGALVPPDLTLDRAEVIEAGS